MGPLNSNHVEWTQDDWINFYDIYADDPIAFCEDVLGFDPDDWQSEALESIRDNDKTAIKSGQGVGKSAVTACIIIWFMTFHHNARIVATAPTKQQLYDVLWAEVKKWLNDTILDGIIIWRKTRIEMLGQEQTWWGTTKTATRPENLAGYHEEYMLIVVDESSGVQDLILETILGTLGHENNRLLMIGNPTKNYGIFIDAFGRDKKYWHTMTVNALEVPRTNKKNIQMLIDKYGENSNVVKVRVYGEAPDQADDVFFPLDVVQSAMYQREPPRIRGPVTTLDIGADIARFGGDETVIGYKKNNIVYPFITYRGKDLMKTCGHIMKLAKELAQETHYRVTIDVKLDDTGLGGGVTDRLNEIKEENNYHWLNIIPVVFGQNTKDKDYGCTTTLMAAELAQLLKIHETDTTERGIALPDDEDLLAQLTTRKYKIDSKGRIKLESKDEMKKRGLPSPDRADCLFLIAHQGSGKHFAIW